MCLKRLRFTETFGVALAPENISFDIAESKSDKPSSITPVVEAIHGGMTRNKTFYPDNELEAAQESWLTPYLKPVLKDHNSWSGDPLGRVKKAEFVASQLLPGKQCLKLSLEINDHDAIERILDGRYRTVSIGASANRVTCSICGKNLVETGFCGHNRGKKYESQECYWIIGGLEFEEISFVNIPGDPHAQIVAPNANKSTKEGRSNELNDDKITESVIDLTELDSLIDTEQSQVVEANSEELKTSSEPIVEADTNAEKSSEEQFTANNTQTVQLQAQITMLQEQVAERDIVIASLERELKESRDSHAILQAQVEEMRGQLQEANDETAQMHDQNVRIATAAHRLLAEHVVNLQIVLGEVKPDEKLTKVGEIIRQKASTIKAKIDELVTKRPKRQMQAVENPGAAIPGPIDVAEDKEDLTVPKTKTLEDLANMATSILTRKQR